MKVVTFGEIMLRLTPPSYGRLLQANSLCAEFAGAEANVAVSLSILGTESTFVSKLPQNEIGQCAINHLRYYGVDTQFIARGGDRCGIMFLEKGASQRAGKVIYDRKYSAIALASANDFQWDKIFDGAQWFHFTGITPALSENLAYICEQACIAAKKRHLKISFDPNYRATLWNKEEARVALQKLMPYVDIFISNVPQVADVLEIYGNSDEEVAASIINKYNCEKVFFTYRKSISASDNVIGGMLFDGKVYRSRDYSIHIIDRVGAGDAFSAGVIHSLLHGFSQKHTIDFAVAASCLKHTINGDFNLTSTSEVEALVESDGYNLLQR